jgi:restriction system protein
MTVPTWITFVEPLLRELATASAAVPRRTLLQVVPDRMKLSAADREEIAGRGGQTRVESRTGWALSYASLAGLVESPSRAAWQLSSKGRELLAAHPRGLPEAVLQEIRRAGKRASEEAASGDRSEPDVLAALADDSTPDERFREAYAQIRANVREALLIEIRSVSPTFFERLVLDLLHALGYGAGRDDLSTTNGGADGGIDGVISLDRLGLEKVYVQAKRYAEDNPVGRPTIQAFLGVLAGRRATKGVFITTSRFSKEARDFARAASDSLVLIDGHELAELMMDHGVGVSVRETFRLISIDSDYFEGG